MRIEELIWKKIRKGRRRWCHHGDDGVIMETHFHSLLKQLISANLTSTSYDC